MPGDGLPGEIANVSTGGTAYLNAPAPFPVGMVFVGVENGLSSALEIRTGGALQVGAIMAGYEAHGTLRVNGGTLNAGQVLMEGFTNSLFEVSGGAKVDAESVYCLGTNFSVLGSDNEINVRADFAVTGDFTAEITSMTHKPIVSPYASVFSWQVNIKFNGVTPAYGDSWTLIDADTTVAFLSNVNISGAV